MSLLFSFGFSLLRKTIPGELNLFLTGFTRLPGLVEVVNGDRGITYDERLWRVPNEDIRMISYFG
ncbi:MAG: hypothetical protein ACOY16_05315 [Chloroflexota bacterium]